MDNLESLKTEEAQLRQKLAEIERQKREILAERRRKEEEERRRKELEQEVTVKVLSCSKSGDIHTKYDPARQDVQAILKPRSNWNRESWFKAKVFEKEIVPKLRALHNLEIEWEEDAEKTYESKCARVARGYHNHGRDRV